MFRYIDSTKFIPAVPARDISDEEAEERGITDQLKASPLYQYDGADPAEPEQIGSEMQPAPPEEED